jgi:ParB-like chromosome segregation protein Spo0J
VTLKTLFAENMLGSRIFANHGMSHSQERDRDAAPNQDQSSISCHLVICRLDELCPHPSYVRHRCSVSAARLSALAALDDFAFREPVVVTRSRMIIDGYTRWKLARQKGWSTILCIEHDLTDEEALRWLIQSHRPSRGLNAYCRTLLALDLEPFLRKQAEANQIAGGQNKDASSLTEAERVDVRSEIAAAAGVSTGNVTKVNQLRGTAHPQAEHVLRAGGISIHRAWEWSRLPPQQQLRELEDYQNCKGTNQTSRRLIQKHVARLSPNQLIPPSLGALLRPLVPDRRGVLDSIVVTEIDASGKVAYLTKDALRTLRSSEDTKCQTLTC